MGPLPADSYRVNIIVELIEGHKITWWGMATSTYGDLHPCSRRVGIMLRNLCTWEVRIPPKNVISNVQAAQIVPNMKTPKYASEILPSMEQTELSWVTQPTCSPPKNELTWPSPISLQLEWGDTTLEHNVLDKVDLSGCTKWDSKNQQEVTRILSEYAEDFAKDDLDLWQMTLVKMILIYGKPQL